MFRSPHDGGSNDAALKKGTAAEHDQRRVCTLGNGTMFAASGVSRNHCVPLAARVEGANDPSTHDHDNPNQPSSGTRSNSACCLLVDPPLDAGRIVP